MRIPTRGAHGASVASSTADTMAAATLLPGSTLASDPTKSTSFTYGNIGRTGDTDYLKFYAGPGGFKKIADGDDWTMPATIEDPKVLDEIEGALKLKV